MIRHPLGTDSTSEQSSPSAACIDPADLGRGRDGTVGGDDGAAVVSVRRFALVEFDGAGRQVRRVVTMFASRMTAELFAVEQGFTDYAVAPASILVSLRE